MNLFSPSHTGPDRPRRRSRIAGLRPSLVITVAAGGALGTTGCFEEDRVISNPPAPGPAECPAPEAVHGACEQPGLECPNGERTGCDLDQDAVCTDAGQWEPIEVSCNPPPPDAGPADAGESGEVDADAGACPSGDSFQGSCDAEDQVCLTGRKTGCGDIDQEAVCHDGAWIVSEATCNPPFLEDASAGDAVVEDAAVEDAAVEDATVQDAGLAPWEELAALPICDAEQTLPNAGDSCEPQDDYVMGGCILDWAAHLRCQDGGWRVRPFYCWTGTWAEWMTGEEDAGSVDGSSP